MRDAASTHRWPDDPPRGTPWDDPISSAPWVFLDAEFTGLDVARDRIVEIALVRRRGEALVDTYETAIAASFARVADEIAGRLRGSIVVTHGGSLDIAMVHRAFASVGLTDVTVPHGIDTLTLARRALAAPSYRLRSLAVQLGLAERAWHSALPDAMATAELFDRLVPLLEPVTPRDLWEVRVGQRGPVRVRTQIARQLEAALASAAPCAIVVRPRGRHEMTLRGVVERWVPPHLYLATDGPTPGLRIVRADRILRMTVARPG